MEEITVEQKEQLKTWAGQRDVLLSEISVLRDEKLKLEKTNKEAADSFTNIQNRILISEGRLLELDKKEKEVNDILSVEISDSITKKTALETQIPELEKYVTVLENQKKSLIESIVFMQSVNSGFAEKNIELEKQIGGVIELAQKNASVVSSLMESLKVSSKEIIDINKKNVAETSMVIGELPRLFFDLQRQTMEKRERITKIKK